ncbi:hypothetical protein AAU61_19495 [Desulfocarbo indianensis]|nr:hypothetical protein AAU61_19495 [Desulfocarbo indianensis]
MKKYYIALLPGLFCVLIFGITSFFFIMPHMEQMILESNRSLLREVSQTAWQLLDTLAKQQAKGHLTRKQAQDYARVALRELRFGPAKQDYFWVVDLAGRVQVSPNQPALEGRDGLLMVDAEGDHFIRRALDLIRGPGSGYISYKWPRLDDPSQIGAKTVYVRLFKPWGWMLADGVYFGEVDVQIGLMYRGLILVGAGVCLAVILLAVYITWRQARIDKLRQEAEEALNEALEKYRAVLESAPNPLVVYDHQGKAIYVNPAFTRVFGWEPGEILGRRIDYVPGDSRAQAAEMVRQVFKGQSGTTSVESRRFDKDGRLLDVRISASTFRDAKGNPAGMIVNISDISESKKAERQLRQSEERYRLLFESAHDAIIIFQGNYIEDCNDQALELFRATREQLLGPHSDFLSPEMQPDSSHSVEKAGRLMAKAMMGGQQFFEWRYRRFDGTFFDAEMSLRQIQLQDGPRMMSILRDITSRKKAENSLKASESRYRSLFESAHDAIFVMQDGLIQDCNQRAFQLFHASPADFKRRHPSHYSPERQPDGALSEEKARRMVFLALEKGFVEFEWLHRRLDGSLFYAEVSLTRLDLPEGPLVLVMMRDATERKAAEEALRESEERLRTVINATPLDIVYFKDQDGRWLEANRMMLEVIGVKGEDYKGKNNAELAELGNEDARAALLEDLASDEHAFGSGGITRGKITLRHASGRPRVFDVLKVPIFHPDGSRRGLSVVGRDITELVEAERQRNEMESQLRHAQKMEAIGTLAGGIAHDFNNILTAIIGYTEAAMNKISRGEDSLPGLKVVLDSSFRARDLVKQLMTFSRGSGGMVQALDLAHVLGDTMKLVEAVTPSLIEVQIKPLPPNAVVKADPTQIQQVIMNLCANAIQAMEDWGGSLRVGLEIMREPAGEGAPHPNLNPGEYVVLEVSDTGPGIEKELAKKIFDPFFSTKPRDKGTGLGLSVVHGIVTSLGGMVTVESRPGSGAVFKVFLPRSLESPASQETESGSRPPKGGGTLLLVEDESQVMKVEQEILESLGYQVAACQSPVEARRLFEENPERFDLVITDYAMPHMSGLELASSLKEVSPRVPVLLCTGYNQDLSENELKLFGVDQTLMKPFTALELGRKLQSMFRTAKRQAQERARS